MEEHDSTYKENHRQKRIDSLSGRLIGAYTIMVVWLMICSNLYAQRTFYISVSGNDANDGRSANTPWKTTNKVNQVIPDLNPGDKVLFKKGDIFHGNLNLTCSGTNDRPIVFSAYGEGNAPVLSGSAQVTSWTKYNDNIWRTNISSLPGTVSDLIIDGQVMELGRFPDASYLTFEEVTGSSGFTDLDVNFTAGYWNQATAVVRTRRWILDNLTISGTRGQAFSFADQATYDLLPGYGYFIQNHLNTLNRFGEWCISPDSAYLYLYAGNGFSPDHHAIEIAVVPNGIEITRSRYIQIQNIQMQFFATHGIYIHNCNNIVINNLNMGNMGIHALVIEYSENIGVFNNTIMNTYDNSIICRNSSDVIIKGNSVQKSGTIAGRGQGTGNISYSGISIEWDENENIQILNNRIDSIGYDGINVCGMNTRVAENYITHTCLVKDDGAGIYTHGENHENVIIEKNVILYSVGNSDGVVDTSEKSGDGIYLDKSHKTITIRNNTIAFCKNGLYIHFADHALINDNLTYDNHYGLKIKKEKGNSGINPDIIIMNNIFYSVKSGTYTLYLQTVDCDATLMGNFSGNCFGHPWESRVIKRYHFSNGKMKSDYLDISDWKATYSGTAENNFPSPRRFNIDEVSKNVVFLTNPAKQINTFPLSPQKVYIDCSRKYYYSHLDLRPFSSIVLMTDTININDIILPDDSISSIDAYLYPIPTSGRVDIWIDSPSAYYLEILKTQGKLTCVQPVLVSHPGWI